jgi:CheY-like chemotaxis protein
VKKSILLADDSPTIQRLVTQTFADAEFEVTSVSNGDAAVRKFEDLRPQIVLADIYMPGKNGYEVCAHIKKHAQLSATPVVLLVGAFDAFDEETARQAGSAAHITKPFEPQALVDLVVSLLQDAPQTAAPAERAAAAAIPVPEPVPVAVAAAPAPAPAAKAAAARAEAAAAPARVEPPKDDGSDLLGLGDLFKPPAEAASSITVSDEEIERIADRVIQKLSTQVIESVAWDVVPDIATKVLREELKRQG